MAAWVLPAAMAAGSLASSFFGGGEETEDERTSYAIPGMGTAPGLAKGVGLITDWMGTPREYFADQTYADLTPAQIQAIEQMKAGAGMAGGMLPGMMGGWQTAMGRPESVLGQGLQDVAANPYLSGIADVMEARSQERMLEDVLPQMQAGAVGRGGLGGSRLAIGAQQAERDRQRSLDEALAGLYGQAWQQGLGAETSRYNQALAQSTAALGQTPNILAAMQTPAQQLFGAGARERAMEQLAIDEAMQRHRFEQMEPYERATAGMSGLMPAATAFAIREGEGRSEYTPSMSNRIGNALGVFGGMMGGVGGMFGGVNPAATMEVGRSLGQYDNPWTNPSYMWGAA